jgi:hypothetical protein
MNLILMSRYTQIWTKLRHVSWDGGSRTYLVYGAGFVLGPKPCRSINITYSLRSRLVDTVLVRFGLDMHVQCVSSLILEKSCVS